MKGLLLWNMLTHPRSEYIVMQAKGLKCAKVGHYSLVCKSKKTTNIYDMQTEMNRLQQEQKELQDCNTDVLPELDALSMGSQCEVY